MKSDDVEEKLNGANVLEKLKENDLTAAQELRIINVILKSIKVREDFL